VLGSGFILCLISLIIIKLKEYKENKYYKNILFETMPKINNINLSIYKNRLDKLTNNYKLQLTKKVIIKNNKGIVLNICPKCGGYLKIVRWRGNPFLGCANYPQCKFYRNYDRIFEMEI